MYYFFVKKTRKGLTAIGPGSGPGPIPTWVPGFPLGAGSHLGPRFPLGSGPHLGPWFPLGPWAYYDYPVAYFEYPVAYFE